MYSVNLSFYREHSIEDLERQNLGDLTLFMINNALNNGLNVFKALTEKTNLPLEEEKFSEPNEFASLIEQQHQQFVNPINQWLHKMISTLSKSQIYNLNHLKKFCLQEQNQLMSYINALLKKSNEPIQFAELTPATEEKHPEISIAMEQYKNINTLYAGLTDQQLQPQQRICNFLKACSQENNRFFIQSKLLGA